MMQFDRPVIRRALTTMAIVLVLGATGAGSVGIPLRVAIPLGFSLLQTPLKLAIPFAKLL